MTSTPKKCINFAVEKNRSDKNVLFLNSQN